MRKTLEGPLAHSLRPMELLRLQGPNEGVVVGVFVGGGGEEEVLESERTRESEAKEKEGGDWEL